ncbi:2-oxoglutarate (2OG) and Fe(II)-dependent oxygenase superfamily protein [Euphorbia peplus]|nr:2-oxoglutarate (2OG) and Fe(II)-dependent oxygenase superfamily protein [Euphorbia peplus]
MSKYVQDMSNDGDEPPPVYFTKHIIPSSSSLPLISLPLINLTLLSSPSKQGLEELEKLKEALISWGCFQAVGHGVSSSFLDKIRQVTKQFFGLPTIEKLKYARASTGFEGYGNDPILSDTQVHDWSDRLFLNLMPENSRNFQLWPDDPFDFREVVDEYAEKMKEIAEIIVKAMARSLNIEEECFLKQYGEEVVMGGRFNYYPLCPKPDSILGVKAHSDGSAITILLQDLEVEALQILKDDQWFRVPVLPHAFLVNAGDQIQIMSNGIFKSPIHRVTASSKQERISIAVFHLPNAQVEIEPAKPLITQQRPQQYRKLTNYSAINFECFQSGKTPLDTVKI